MGNKIKYLFAMFWCNIDLDYGLSNGIDDYESITGRKPKSTPVNNLTNRRKGIAKRMKLVSEDGRLLQ